MAVVRPDVDELRDLELARLDTIHQRLWGGLMGQGNEALSRQETVLLLLKVMDQRAKLLGLYASRDTMNGRPKSDRRGITLTFERRAG